MKERSLEVYRRVRRVVWERKVLKLLLICIVTESRGILWSDTHGVSQGSFTLNWEKPCHEIPILN